MSADDCIAVLVTRIYPDSKAVEYRVIWAMAIENCHINDKTMKQYFEKASVFEEYVSAINYAYYLDKQYGSTEHGVLIIKDKNGKTWDEILHEKRFVSNKGKLKR